MKKYLLTVLALFCALTVHAVVVTTTAGNLSEQVTDTGITELTVVGTIDARDFHFIHHELRGLHSLDLSDAQITGYICAEREAPLFSTEMRYSANELPPSSLFGMKLKSLVLPSTLESIGFAALGGSQLPALTLPASLKKIGNWAFAGSSMTSIVVPDGVTIIGNGAFRNCKQLESITLGTSVTEIGDGAFLGCDNLQELVIPKGCPLNAIGDGAFMKCGLTKVDFASLQRLNNIGKWCFANSSLVSATLPSSVLETGDGAFFYATSLTSLSTSTTTVPPYFAAGCEALSNDDIFGEGVRVVGDYALYNSSELKELTLPASLAYLGDYAMAGTIGIKEIVAKAVEPAALGTDVWQGVNQPAVRLYVPQNSIEGYEGADQWKEFELGYWKLYGDVNLDGAVNVTDINLIVSSILSHAYLDLADLSDDGQITVTDVNLDVSVILSGTAPIVKFKNYNTTPDLVSIADFDITPGETKFIEIELDNLTAYSAIGCDLVLPEGLTVVDNHVGITDRSARHHVAAGTPAEGTLRIVGFSLEKERLAGNNGGVLRLAVRADKSLAPDAEILVENVVLVTDDNQEYYAAPTTTQVRNTTGVDDLTAKADRVYCQAGQLVIETAQAGTAQLVLTNGAATTVNVEQGINVFDVDNGFIIVRLNGKSHKLMVK